MAGITAAEAAWWAVTWCMGISPAPYIFTYLALAFAGLGVALILRLALQPNMASPNWSSVLAATLLVGLGASFFLPLKYAIPKLVPFWLDQPIFLAERSVFAADAWVLLDRCFGWAAVPMDGLYALWLPTQALILFLVILQPASAAKARVLIAYILAWFVLGVVAAILLSSAGPIFYDRLFGGTTFRGLKEALQGHGARFAIAESDRMWRSLASRRPGIVAGISAVPSIHVAISVWMVLAARTIAPRAAGYALVYALVIWVASVQLGWHYVTDGLAGTMGMLGIWRLTGRIKIPLGTFVSADTRNPFSV